MDINLKPYQWQFFRYYGLGYLVGLAIIFAADVLLNIRMQDLLVVIILCVVVPTSIAANVVKEQGRYFNEAERKVFVKKTSFIAFLISIIPSVIFVAYCILFKLIFTPQEIPKELATVNIAANPVMTELLQMSISELMGILLISFLLYYAVIWLILGVSFKQLEKQYAKKS